MKSRSIGGLLLAVALSIAACAPPTPAGGSSAEPSRAGDPRATPATSAEPGRGGYDY